MDQIEISNATSNAIDPFLQIVIGGDYFIEIKKGSAQEYIECGERGITYQTDCLRGLESGGERTFTTEILTEYRASYFQIMRERLQIELWTSGGGLFLNNFIGIASIPLLDIASGSFKQTVQIYPFGDDVAHRVLATISFNIIFEEIWDFHLTFVDWKTSSLEKEKDKSLVINPSVELKIISRNALQGASNSETLQRTKAPHWSALEDGITYRGTLSDLAGERLLINVWNHSLLVHRTLIGTKSVPMKDAMNFVKCEMVIHKPKKRTEENIRLKQQTCAVQGTVRLGLKQKYNQLGERESISHGQHYLCVQIQRMAVFDQLDDSSEVTVFAEVDWAGAIKKTRGVRRPNVNETLLFHIPIDQTDDIAEYLNDELATKSEIQVNIWADTQSGKGQLENLGSARLCLGQIHYQKFEDKYYTDERTKQKHSFQCRVYSTTLKLQSAFYDTSNSGVTMSVWFQPELPFPQVDLGRLKGKEEDSYPSPEIDLNLKNGAYLSRFNQVIQRNFPPDYPTDDRRFDQLFISDQYRQRHFLPLYLSKITPPDSNLQPIQKQNISPDQQVIPKDAQTLLTPLIPRGIRTLTEIAHFVRCLPFREGAFLLGGRDRVWASPDFMLKMRVGSVEEHAILLASMFRACKFEEVADLPGNESEKKGRKGSEIPSQSSNISDRVFVCLGKLRSTGQDHAWVLTFNKTFDQLTFWEPTLPKKWVLDGRISQDQCTLLEGYLSPNLTEEEKKELQVRREQKRQEQKTQDQENDEMEFEKKPSPLTPPANYQGQQFSQESHSEDEEDDDIADFVNQLNAQVQLEDMDQLRKGCGDINLIGRVAAQSKQRQQQLRALDYAEQQTQKKPNKFLADQDKERLEREKQRLDKHLLPVEYFKSWKTGSGENLPAGVLPYAQIDLLFNHKNIWANLQCANPSAIWYHIHDEKQWLPLITDTQIQHPILSNNSGDQNMGDKGKVGNDIEDYKMRGDYMKVFQPFYEAKGLEGALNQLQVQRHEDKILKEVEIAIKQIRSSRNLPTKLRKNATTMQILRLQLDLLEDIECGRLTPQQQQQHKQLVERELLKLVPESYKISLLPAFFNYHDAERIRTMICDQMQDFISMQKGGQSGGGKKKAMFAIGVKIYAFQQGVCSVRVAVARMAEEQGDQGK
ncbi:hypothetical protein FGO68_gene4983 [Halteria grandinella]|uniref:Uncharacterized protein n=1 Tax=Halteria grandinella TaxID=5974 RepID=A0A8J8P717_HALGN|nr:hypothetical protein FGO68_gene4983 [Halteria grandinella]